MYRQSEKNLLSNNISSTYPHNMANFSPLAAEIGSGVWSTPANFNGFCVASWLCYCSDVAHRRPTKLCKMFGHLLGWYIIYSFLGALAPDGILPGAKFTLHPNLVFAYISSVTAHHCSSGHQPNFAASYMEWNYRTFAEGATYIQQGGHHVGHRPTFWLFLFLFLICFTSRQREL